MTPAHTLPIEGARIAVDDGEFPMSVVVDGDMPVRLAAGRGEQVRQDEGAGANVVVLGIDVADLADVQPGRGQLRLAPLAVRSGPAARQERRVLAPDVGRTRLPILQVAMAVVQEPDVEEVDVPLVALEVVALAQQLDGIDPVLGDGEETVAGQQRRLAGAEVGEDDPVLLDAWVRGVTDALVEGAAGWLPGLFEAPAGNVEEPTVVDAADP